MLGVGALCQTICLAALEYGLGTCIADQSIMYDRYGVNMPISLNPKG